MEEQEQQEHEEQADDQRAFEKAMRMVKDQLVCTGPCGGAMLHKSHMTRSKHPMRPLTDEESNSWVDKKQRGNLGRPRCQSSACARTADVSPGVMAATAGAGVGAS